MLSWQPNWKNNGLPQVELSHHTGPKLFKIPSILNKVLLASTLLHHKPGPSENPQSSDNPYFSTYSVPMLSVLTPPTQIFPQEAAKHYMSLKDWGSNSKHFTKELTWKGTITMSTTKLPCHNRNHIIETNPIFEKLGLSLILKLWVN